MTSHDKHDNESNERTNEAAYGALSFSPQTFIRTHTSTANIEDGSGHGPSFADDYNLGPMIGQGSFGNCFNCTHIVSDATRAVKVMHKSKSRTTNRQTRKEFEILAMLDHPNILRVYEMYEDATYFFVVTDLYAGGDLFDVIDTHGALSERNAAAVIHKLLSSINYCHQQNLVHRDLKPENILLPASGDFNDIKLIDFGFARHEKQSKDNKFSDVVGSPAYVSPQVLNKEYTRACDIWSIGVIAFVILSGVTPFDGDSDDKILAQIRIGYFNFEDPAWDNISEEAKDLVYCLLKYDEESRPTAEQALRNPWLQGHQQTQSQKGQNDKEELLENALFAMEDYALNSCCKLKQATAALLTSQIMAQEDRSEVDEIFRALDRNCNGSVSLQDLQAAYRNCMGAVHSKAVMRHLTQNISLCDTPTKHSETTISYSELSAVLVLALCTIDESLLQAAFSFFDSKDKGSISASDLQISLYLEYDMACRIISEATGGSDTVDYEAFCQACLSESLPDYATVEDKTGKKGAMDGTSRAVPDCRALPQRKKSCSAATA